MSTLNDLGINDALDSLTETVKQMVNAIETMCTSMHELMGSFVCILDEFSDLTFNQNPSFIEYARSLVRKHGKEKPNVTWRYFQKTPRNLPYQRHNY